MDKKVKPINNQSTLVNRPAYLFDDALKASIKKVKEIIEREEREQNKEGISYGRN
jgi:hypothetical protein